MLNNSYFLLTISMLIFLVRSFMCAVTNLQTTQCLHVRLYLSRVIISVLINVDLTNECLLSAIRRQRVSNQKYSCDTCGRQYRRFISLQRHKRLECGKEAQFGCAICYAKFKHKHSLLRHYNVHVIKKSFT